MAFHLCQNSFVRSGRKLKVWACVSLLALAGLALAGVFTAAHKTAHAGATAGGPVKGRVELRNTKNRGDANGVVVWLEPLGVSNVTRVGGPTRRAVNQKNKRFTPHVVAVETGSVIEFPNNDPYFHNIFSVFNGKRFDLGLYAGGESRPVNFNRSGLSYIYCNIHPQMSAVIVTVNTPYFAVSDASGQVSIANVPVGRYRLKVWHERARPEVLAGLTKEVQVAATGLDLGTIGVSEEGFLPRPHPDKHGAEYDTTNRAYRRY